MAATATFRKATRTENCSLWKTMNEIWEKLTVLHKHLHKARISFGYFKARDDSAGFQQVDNAGDAQGFGA